MHVIEFFAAGALGFYVAIIVVSLLLTALLENDHPTFSGLCLIGLFWYLAWLKVFNVVDFATRNPGEFALCVVAYFALGAISLYPKWYGFVSDSLDDQAHKLRAYGDPSSKLSDKLSAPEPSQNKEHLISWAVYWPWSMFWFILRHPMRRIGRAIYDGMEASLSRMSQSMTKRAKTRLDAIAKRA